MHQEPLHVGYILKMFPRLSETFVLNELLELERLGVELSIFSLMYPADGRFHGGLADLQAGARYFPSERAEVHWQRLREQGDLFAMAPDRWKDAVEFLARCGVNRDLEMLFRAIAIGSEARRRGVGHLHAHFATGATRMAALVNLLTGISFSFTAHAKDIFRATVDREVFAELVQRSSFCITVSDFNKEFILANTPGIEEDKILRLYNGVDLERFRPTERAPAETPPHIVSVGRLVPKKGFDHLLRALATCRQEGLQFTATIVGDGDQMESLLRLRDELGLADSVSFPGAVPQEKVRQLLDDATLVALACVPDEDGNMDALPTVLLEALACDLPIVSTRLTGIPEIVGDDAGLLVEPGDDVALARALTTLIKGEPSAGWAPGNSRRRAGELFDLRKNAATLRGLFAWHAVMAPADA